MTPHADDDDFSSKQHILERDGCPIHYWLSGPVHSPLVVLTHGATVDHHTFDVQIPVLSQDYRVLTWDVRGHGLSQPIGKAFSIRAAVEDLLAILDQLGAQEVSLVGQSMGGNIAQELLFLYPERVKALVALDCACNTFKLSPLEKYALAITPALLRLYPYDLLLHQAAERSATTSEAQHYIYEASRQLPRESYITILVETSLCLHYEPDYKITKPLLLLRGDHDNLGNFKKIMPLWAKRDPNSSYIIVPDAGHCANQDNPAFVNQALLGFLQQHT